jgi:hypothetical protein
LTVSVEVAEVVKRMVQSPSCDDDREPLEDAASSGDSAECNGAGVGESASGPEDRIRQVDRLWAWTLNEDGLLINRMSVSLLAQSILLAAAVGLLTISSPSISERAVQIVLDLVGIVITGALWHVFTLHAAHIRLIGDELDKYDPAVYGYVHTRMRESRESNFLERAVVRRRGTKWVIGNVISAAILAIWLTLLAADLLSLMALK